MRGRTLVALFVLIALTAQAKERVVNRTFIAAVDARRTLRIAGTPADETIILEVLAAESRVALSWRAGAAALQTRSFALEAFDRLELDAGPGADFVNVVDPEQLLDRKRIDMRGGDGDNIVALSHVPFEAQRATRMKSLLLLSRRVQHLAQRAADATAAVLRDDAMKHAGRLRTSVADEAAAVAVEAEKTLFAPATELLERTLPALQQRGESLAAVTALEQQHQQLVTEVSAQLDPTNGVYPPDDNSEPRRRPVFVEETTFEEREQGARARGARMLEAGAALGARAESLGTVEAAAIENAAGAIDRSADAFEQRAERLADAAESAGADAARELRASADRLLAIVGELRALSGELEDAGRAVRDEIARAAAPRSGERPAMAAAALIVARAGANCTTPNTTKTFVGGSGFDFFFPLSAPSQGWSIDGGAGFNILFGGFAADDIKGGADTDVVFGLKGNDRIRGGAGTDLLFGEFILDLASLTGDDCIDGEGDHDLIAGDNFVSSAGGTAGGSDTLTGGAGTDLVFGDDVLDFFDSSLPGGSDDIKGNGDVDLLFGCGDADVMEGNEDIDLIVGNGGGDTIRGHDGRSVNVFGTNIELGNLMLGDPGADEMYGGKGIDIMIGDLDGDRMWGAAQLDLMFGGPGADEMRGEAGGVIATIDGIPIRLGNLMLGGDDGDRMWGGGDLDVMLGQGDADRIIGFDPSFYEILGIDMDVLHGGDGNDYLEGDDEYALLATSNDFMFGRGGVDDMKGGSNRDFMFGGDDADTMEGDSNALTLLLSMDFMHGGKANDTMKGGNALDIMLGRAGDDTMTGDDEAFGVVSPDLMFGGDGNDTMNGGSFLDLMTGGDGADHMTGDSNLVHQPLSFDFMFGGPGPDEMHGGNAWDLMFGQTGCDRMFGDSSIQLRLSSDLMFGGPDDDFMDGGVNPDLMFGEGGNDTMLGDVGHSWMFLSIDLMFGGEDCDTMSGGRAVDWMWGDAGVDRMDGEWGPDLIAGGDNGDTINGGEMFDVIDGNGGNDLIHGDSGMDVIEGGADDDCLYGDDFLDIIAGGSGNDCVRGGNGPDALAGGDGDDRVFGDAGGDFLFGNDGDDILDGGNGWDKLFGGGGTDQVFGGPGLDWPLVGEQRHQTGSSNVDCDCRTEVCKGTLCVRKFNDVNGNGIEDSGEAGLANWVFGVTCGCSGSAQLTTDAAGNACGLFFGGTCKVIESLQSGWQPTTATEQNANVVSGGKVTLKFGNRRPANAELCIRKFNDANGNGVLDAGEAGLGNWTFQLAGNGVSSTLTTRPDGRVCTGVPAGTYSVTEQLQSGWTPTTAITQSVTAASGGVTNVLFGNRERILLRTRICVFKFDDQNANGVRDTNEPPLAGWTFQITGSGFTTTVTTDASGNACAYVLPGTYSVTETLQAGWSSTTGAVQNVHVMRGMTERVTFGNHREPPPGKVCITKFNDLNGNGVQDPGENGIAGWTFQLSGIVGMPPVATDAKGVVCVELVFKGVQITEQPREGWTATTPTTVIVQVQPGETKEVKFGNRETRREAARGEVCVFIYQDRNVDGVYAPQEGLANWDVQVNGGALPSIRTGHNGSMCRGYPVGSYTFTEVVQPGWYAETAVSQNATVVNNGLVNLYYRVRRQAAP